MSPEPPESRLAPPDPAGFRIRNQHYPRWFDVAGNVLVGGMLVAFAVIGTFGWRVFGDRTMYVLFAAVLAILPIAAYGWLQIWDLSRPGPRRGVTARALFEGLIFGIRRRGFGAAIEWRALTAVRTILPSVRTVTQLTLGQEVEIFPPFRFPARAVTRVRFAPDPAEDFEEAGRPVQLYAATVEIHSGRLFRLTVDEGDAERLNHWAEANGIPVCECDGHRRGAVEPPGRPDGPGPSFRRGTRG